ncbi:MmcQ/YjbR family DNA-binding protein [Microlunatus ginsengisoli]|uniref:MmcQ/YjbR family DNA-binding protein n=1 Tax=Microlunatus ginsengisoli TaxID=363863 RepID=A0ABP7AQX4_9ACTN
MATWQEVVRLALALPETAESTSYGNVAWKVRGKGFIWERPLRTSDLKALGDEPPPAGPILAAYVDGLAEKEAVLAAYPDCCFTIAHFDGFPAVLVLLDEIDPSRLEELVVDAWLARAPRPLAADYLVTHPEKGSDE